MVWNGSIVRQCAREVKPEVDFLEEMSGLLHSGAHLPLIPPCPLLPHGEKGEFGRPHA
jgi:hypothetical protein